MSDLTFALTLYVPNLEEWLAKREKMETAPLVGKTSIENAFKMYVESSKVDVASAWKFIKTFEISSDETTIGLEIQGNGEQFFEIHRHLEKLRFN